MITRVRITLTKVVSLVIIISFACGVLSGCSSRKGLNAENEGVSTSHETQVKVEASMDDKKVIEDGEKVIPQEDKKTDIERMISEMSLEKKVGQVFIMSLRYMPDNKDALNMTEDVRQRINRHHLGGVILFSENLETIAQTRKLIEDMQSISKLPMFIAIDEEGGSTSRLNKEPLLHSTTLPTNRTIGKTGDARYAAMAAQVIAQEVAALGFNMNFAPIADVDSNPLNPIIGKRSFGKDPELVAKMAAAQVEEMQTLNIIAVLKHFPGHGDTSTDTHTGAAIVNHDRSRLEQVEFLPFRKGIAAGADGIMTAHVQVPAITKSDLPATLSKEILTDILREEMKYEGLIITDALEMQAVSKFYTPEEAVVKAFEAGADILLMPYSIETAYKAMLDAVKSGRISEERLNSSVTRILRIKHKRGILEGKKTEVDPEKVLGNKEHLDIAEEIQKAAE